MKLERFGIVSGQVAGASALALVVISTLACAPAPTSEAPAASAPAAVPVLVSDVTTADEQAALTPAAVLAELKAGNERFANGALTPRDYRAQVQATASGQYPKAVVLSCLDSRIPPELVFDQGIGDLFVARVAGNFENEDILGSMEFATKVAGARLIVVLGHNACGAVKGACDMVELGNLTATLANIAPAVSASASVPGEKNSKNEAFVAAVTDANVRQTMRDIVDRSPLLAGLVAEGKLALVGGLYDLRTGRVTWIES